MNTTDPFHSDDHFTDDVGMFEAAVHAQTVSLPEISLTVVLAALDGSNQNGTAQLLAGRMAAALNGRVVERDGLRDDDAVLAAVAEASAGLLVLPVPFGSDIGDLKDESLGEVVDQLLGRLSVPILAVRQPMDERAVTAAMADIVLPLAPGEPRNELAVAWACRLLRGSGGQCRMLEIADRDVLAEADRMELQADGHPSWQRAMSRCFAGLVSVAQRTATASGFNVSVAASQGRFVAETLSAAHDLSTLTIAAGSHDRRSTTYHRAADLILGSQGPVLIV